jgi:outer membrane receptor protein involved in Fe transport
MRKQHTGLSVLIFLAHSAHAFSNDNLEHVTGKGSIIIEEVLVTAQKKPELLSHVPQAISAFDDSLLDSLLVSTAGDLQFHVPNLTYTDTGTGAPNLTLRGVGTASQIAGADVGVGVHINDVYINSGSMGGALFDVQQVMVLRGPQGTLYGRNSTGGAINIITNRPAGEFEGYMEARLGSYGNKGFEGAVSIPLSDTVRFRLAGLYSKNDGYVKNEYTGNDINGENAYILRPTFSIDISDNTTLDIIANYVKSDTDSLGFDKLACTRDDRNGLGCSADSLDNDLPDPRATIDGLGLLLDLQSTFGPGAPQAVTSADPFAGAVNPSDIFKTSIDLEPVSKDELADITFNLVHHFDDMTFTSLTSILDQRNRYIRDIDGYVGTTPFVRPVALSNYNHGSNDFSGSAGGNVYDTFSKAFGYTDYSAHERQYLQELRLNSAFDGDHNFLLGAFYMDTTIESDYVQATTGLDAYANILRYLTTAQDIPSPSEPPFIYDQNAGSTIESLAAFGEYYYQINEDVKFTVGARWTRDDKHIRHRQQLYNTFPGAPSPGFADAAGTGVDRSDRFEAATGRIGVDWNPDLSYTDHTLLFAFLSRGYRSGGINNGTNTNNPTYKPEFLHSFEVGTKNTFFDNSAQLNLTAFYYDYNDYQIFQEFVFNVDAEVSGIELEYVQYFTESFSADLNVSYLSTKIKEGSAVDKRNPTAGNSNYTTVSDVGGQKCIVELDTFNAPLFDGGLGGDPYALQDPSLLETCSNAADNPDLGLPIGSLLNGLPTDLSGNEFPNAPEWTAKLGLTYFNEVTSKHYLTARLDYYWQTNFSGRIFNNGAEKIDSWQILNLFMEFGPISDYGYYGRLSVSNLLDDEHITGLDVRSQSRGLSTELYALEPRQVTASVGYKF